MKTISIETTHVGHEHPVYIVAEAGFNHEGNLDTALKMIEEAAKAGANAIKFQSYQANELVKEDSQHYEIIRSGELSLEDHVKLVKAAQNHQITFFSTPFSFECVEMLEQVNVPAYKIASMDLTHLPLLHRVAEKGKPMLLSTGTGTLGEIEQAIATIQSTGNHQIVLLHCLSEYPTPPEHVHLQVIPMLKTVFDVPVGFSDHTLGTSIPLAAAVVGACVLEKHFTLDRSLPGPDHKLSVDPPGLRTLVKDVRTAQASLGTCTALAEFFSNRPDQVMGSILRRSIFAKADIAEGTVLTESLVRYVRPGEYIGPEFAPMVLGKTVRRKILKGEPITWDVLFA